MTQRAVLAAGTCAHLLLVSLVFMKNAILDLRSCCIQDNSEMCAAGKEEVEWRLELAGAGDEK